MLGCLLARYSSYIHIQTNRVPDSIPMSFFFYSFTLFFFLFFFFLTRCFTHVFLRVQFGCVLNIYKYMYIQNLCIHVCVCVCVWVRVCILQYSEGATHCKIPLILLYILYTQQTEPYPPAKQMFCVYTKFSWSKVSRENERVALQCPLALN